MAVLAAPGLTGRQQSAETTPPDVVGLRLIVTSTVDEAQQVVERLTRGEDFAALAREVSIDPSADAGGSIGPIAVSSLRPELRQALEGLTPGRFSTVVAIPTGFAILTIASDIEAGARPGGSTRIGAFDARGAVKYLLGIDGLAEADNALAQFQKAPDWNQDPRSICSARTQSLASMRASLETFLSSSGQTGRGSQSPFDLIQTHVGLAQLHAYEGHMAQAVERFEQAHRLATTVVPAAQPYLDEALGIAYLQKSGIENGVFHTPGDRCLLTVRSVGAYAQTADSEKAISYFLSYLKAKADEPEVKWLLNLAFMTLGGYPDKVPAEHLIPPSVLASVEDVGRFRDVAPLTGLNSVASAGGAIVDDFDNDGDFDVVTSSMNSCERMTFFRNNGNGTFVERGVDAGFAEQLGGLNLVQADYDNDGCVDILNLRGGWQLPQRKSLLHNNCDGTFTDVTSASGLAVPTSTQTAAWVDIDNDSFLDLFIGNEDRPPQLFLNKRDGTFEDIAKSAGIRHFAFAKGVAAADYDNDGDQDLYVSNFSGANLLYRNEGNRTFTERAVAAGVPGPGRGFPTWFFDYDNDGWEDLFATSYFMSLDESVRTYLGLPHNAATMKLYRNRGDSTFEDMTTRVGLDKVLMPMGSNFGDIDNDGFLDMYLGTGSPSYGALVPNVLLRNRGGTRFVDVTVSSGTGELHKGHGVAFADLDNDGDADILVELGGSTPGDAHALRLFENPGHGADWLGLRLVGTKSNRGAIGARISVTVEYKDGSMRSIHRTVGSGGSFGASPLQQHIGLGREGRIVGLDIRWPGTGTRQRFTSVPGNQVLEIRESESAYMPLNRRLVRLGGTSRDPR